MTKQHSGSSMRGEIGTIIQVGIMLGCFLVISASCQNPDQTPTQKEDSSLQGHSMETISKPYARYWWFASEIKKEDVLYNLQWLKDHGFGGVELAWVYPLNSRYKSLDQNYTPRQEWLSDPWQEIVEYAIRTADSLGLACDMTMGTLWPFGDSQVTYEEASQVFGNEHRQTINRSWEYPDTVYVVDHLTQKHYMDYFHRVLGAFPQPETEIPQSYFIDSWEVETKGLWADGFDKEFQQAYGYDITSHMGKIYDSAHKEQRYDYMKLLSHKVLDFYRNFDQVLNDHSLYSRGQCSGAPCDILSAYALLDIPEGEAMLYEPEFNSIPASSALLSGQPVVSAETFTCLYGWPGHYMREEQTADLKMLADALFANGVNHIIWHGKAHNPKDQDSVNFYATIHLGDQGSLAPEIPAFNEYLGTVSRYMKQGRSYSDVAVYLPTEDAWIKGIMPKEQQFIWAWGYYEMRYIYFPKEVAGHHPMWINGEFLAKGEVQNGELQVGKARFKSLYLDVDYLDFLALQSIIRLAREGLPVTIKNIPEEPGTIKQPAYGKLLDELISLPNVTRTFNPTTSALVSGTRIPAFWARQQDQTLFLFFANPTSKNLTFPLEYGQSFTEETHLYPIEINFHGHQHALELEFEPYQSLLYKVEGDRVEKVDMGFQPSIPEVRARPADFEAPWLVH